VLAIAAVIGRDFNLETLRAVAGVDEEALISAIEEAVRIGVLEERSRPGQVSYRFAHAFFRQTLYEEMIAPRRLRLHQEVARALEAQYGQRREEHAAELAEHFAQSTEHADLAKAVEYGELAAHRATAVYAHTEAASHLERCLAVQEVLDPSDKQKLCDLLLALTDALISSGEPYRAAEDVAERALSFANDLRDVDRACRACYSASLALWRYGGPLFFTSQEYTKWAERYDSKAPAGSTHRIAADLVRANILIPQGRLEETWRLTCGALDLALKLGDRALIIEAAGRVVAPPTIPAHQAERMARATELWELERSGVAARILSPSITSCLFAAFETGQRAWAEEILNEVERLARESHDPQAIVYNLYWQSRFTILDGRLEEFVAALTDRQAQVESVGAMGVAARIEMGTVRPLIMLGRADEAMPAVLATLAAGNPVNPHALAQRAILLALAGQYAEAQGTVRQLLKGEEEGFELATPVLVLALDASLVTRDLEAIERLKNSLAGLEWMCAAQDHAVSVGRLLGEAAALFSEYEQARLLYSSSLTACQNFGFRPEIALIRLDLAELLLEHYPDERDAAIEHLGFAIAELRDMKMQPALERALRHRGLLKA
jgi:hypothetical protein